MSDVEQVLAAYDQSFAGFAVPAQDRDVRALRKLYVSLMEARQERIAQFRRLLAALGVDQEPTWAGQLRICEALVPWCHGRYRPAADPIDRLDVALDPPWGAVAIDWGIYIGEAFRAHYPSMYWHLGAHKGGPGSVFPIMSGVPDHPPDFSIGFVITQLDTLCKCVVDGQAFLDGVHHSAAREGYVHMDSDRIARLVASLHERLRKNGTRLEDRQAVWAAEAKLPPPPLPGKGYSLPGPIRRVSEAEARYLALRAERVDTELVIWLADSTDPEEAAALLEASSFRTGDHHHEADLAASPRLQQVLDAIHQAWPQVDDPVQLMLPPYLDPGEVRGRAATLQLGPDAPARMLNDIITIATNADIYYEADWD